MAWALYMGLVPAISLWAMLAGWRSERPDLTRCAAIVLAHGVFIQLAAAIWPMVEGQGYPFMILALALVGVLRAICVNPASRGCAVLAGSVLFGLLTTLIYGVVTFWHGPAVHTDWAYFAAQFTMGWANLLILLGWTHERSLRRVADPCLRAAAGLVQLAHRGGLAR